MARKRRKRTAVVLLLAGAIAAAAFTFTASNTVPGSDAGIGSGTISGYAVSNIEYTLNTTDPSTIDSVQFDLDKGTATDVRAQLASGGSWYSCSVVSGSTYSCTTTGASTSGATSLTVAAAQ